MFYYLAQLLHEYISVCNVVHYISFRSMASLLTSLFCTLLFGQRFIDFSKTTFQTNARPFTPENHQAKGNTPSMGGCFILCVVIINIFLWCDLSKPDAWLFVLVLTGFGAIGFIDDLYKVWYKNGLYPRQKFASRRIRNM